jgi:hypothetical protein
MGLFLGIITGIDHGTVGTGLKTFTLSLATVLIDKNRPILLFLKDGLVRAGVHTVWFIAVVAVNGQKAQAEVGKRSLFPLIDAHIFKGARLNVVPFFARDTAGTTAGTPALIEEKSVLSHFTSPLFSIHPVNQQALSNQPSAFNEALAES